MPKEIKVFDYAESILKALKKGVLVSTRHGDKVNSMTISWGMLGIEWGKPIFTVFIRENRFTRTQLDGNPEFTISIPVGQYDHKIIAFCGSHSGRDTDKAKALNLDLVDGQSVSVPAIRQLPLTLECRVLYRQKQDRNAIPEAIRKTMYPEDVDSSNPMENRDYHVAYYGEIVKAYILD